MDETIHSVLRVVKAGRTAEVAQMLEQDPSLIAARDNQGTTLLHWAVDGGDLNLIDLLLPCGVDINGQSNEGVTALHWAAHYGGLPVVRFLLQHGADPVIATNQGQTPLHWAALRDPLIVLTEDDRPELIELLLTHGAKGEVPANDAGTLHGAGQGNRLWDSPGILMPGLLHIFNAPSDALIPGRKLGNLTRSGRV